MIEHNFYVKKIFSHEVLSATLSQSTLKRSKNKSHKNLMRETAEFLSAH